MTDLHDLRPKDHFWTKLAVALIGAAGLIWGALEWAATTPKRAEFTKVQDDVVRIRLDIVEIKGELKAANIRQDEGFRALGAKLDEAPRPRRRRGDER